MEEVFLQLESSSKGVSNDKVNGTVSVPRTVSNVRLQPANSPYVTRAGTPVTSETPLAESIAADDALLRQYAAAFVDIKLMDTNTWRLWRQIISLMLPGTPEDSLQAEGL